ncbi:MAG: hypothetical protein Hyperionvirus10_48 [Hyperionvirus sp.]|uniref:Uncharacterized protein n=1 Tax=Hyperionvirus sp. TaxID=2487770 RepID=A0A3G5A9F1_9VIRU|nr:MAG: hypothetical protein Hyperionvirus10_48 [Hyperionvirus sp.]
MRAIQTAVSRRLVYYGGRMNRFKVFAKGPKIFSAGFVCAAAVVLPMAAIAVPEKKAVSKLPPGISKDYHTQAIDFIRYTNWKKTLENCNEEKFREVLGYIAYCKRNVPALIPVINSLNMKRLLLMIRHNDKIEAKALKKVGLPIKPIPTWLSILNETIGLDNLPDISEAYNIFGGMIYGGDGMDRSSEYFLDNIKKKENRIKILGTLLESERHPNIFQYIKKYNMEQKIIFPKYSKYAYNYSNFKYLADNDLIDPVAVVDYMEVAGASNENSPEDKRQILGYLLILNPHRSAKRSMTLMLLNSMQGKIKEERMFVSSLIKAIGYKFRREEIKKFEADLNVAYKKLNYYASKNEANGFVEYLKSEHAEFSHLHLEGASRYKVADDIYDDDDDDIDYDDIDYDDEE